MDRQTETQNDYCHPRCACAPRVNNQRIKIMAYSCVEHWLHLNGALAIACAVRKSFCIFSFWARFKEQRAFSAREVFGAAVLAAAALEHFLCPCDFSCFFMLSNLKFCVPRTKGPLFWDSPIAYILQSLQCIWSLSLSYSSHSLLLLLSSNFHFSL